MSPGTTAGRTTTSQTTNQPDRHEKRKSVLDTGHCFERVARLHMTFPDFRATGVVGSPTNQQTCQAVPAVLHVRPAEPEQTDQVDQPREHKAWIMTSAPLTVFRDGRILCAYQRVANNGHLTVWGIPVDGMFAGVPEVGAATPLTCTGMIRSAGVFDGQVEMKNDRYQWAGEWSQNELVQFRQWDRQTDALRGLGEICPQDPTLTVQGFVAPVEQVGRAGLQAVSLMEREPHGQHRFRGQLAVTHASLHPLRAVDLNLLTPILTRLVDVDAGLENPGLASANPALLHVDLLTAAIRYFGLAEASLPFMAAQQELKWDNGAESHIAEAVVPGSPGFCRYRYSRHGLATLEIHDRNQQASVCDSSQMRPGSVLHTGIVTSQYHNAPELSSNLHPGPVGSTIFIGQWLVDDQDSEEPDVWWPNLNLQTGAYLYRGFWYLGTFDDMNRLCGPGIVYNSDFTQKRQEGRFYRDRLHGGPGRTYDDQGHLFEECDNWESGEMHGHGTTYCEVTHEVVFTGQFRHGRAVVATESDPQASAGDDEDNPDSPSRPTRPPILRRSL